MESILKFRTNLYIIIGVTKIKKGFLKKITHMWRTWDTPQNFLLAFKNKKKQNFEKWKQNVGDNHHFTHVYQTPQSRTVPEIQSEKKFLSFLVIFCPFTPSPPPPTTPKTCATKNTIKWCMLTQIWSATDNFLSLLGHFLLFYPTIDPKNQNFEKM